MRWSAAPLVALAAGTLLAGPAQSHPPAFVPVPALPPEIVALAQEERPEAFALAPGLALAAFASGDAPRSVVRVAVHERRAEIPVAGRVAALLASASGEAWAIVGQNDRKGAVERRASLVALDVRAARPSRGVPVPVSARGLALAPDGGAIFVAASDEIRTYRLPDLTSGPLYRVPGPNVGLGPAPWGGTVWVVAQLERVGLVDVGETQGRDGLPLRDAAPAPMPLRGLVEIPGASLLAVGHTGDAWRVEVRPPEAGPLPIPDPVPLPVPREGPPPLPPPPPAPPPPTPAPSPSPPPVPIPSPASPGSVSGGIAGPERGSVEWLLALGPDNVLKEAARTHLAADGSYRFEKLAPGTYRIVAAGAGGRVVVCEPPYVTVRLDGSQPVIAPEMSAIRVP